MSDINSDAVKYGRNAEHPLYSDDHYIRCSRCGFICHRDRDQSEDKGMMGWGITQADVTTGSRTIKDPVVTGGCPQCGTFKYK